jgi:FkbH-like protein
MPTNFRQEINDHLAAEHWNAALASLHQYWAAEPTSSAAGFILASFEKLRPVTKPTAHRIVILRSFTLEPVTPVLRAGGLLGGLDISVKMGSFDNYVQEILDPASALYTFDPHTVILAVKTRDVLPELWEGYTDLAPGEAQRAVDTFAENLASWLTTFRANSSANLILHNFAKPRTASAGILDAQGESAQALAVEDLNRRLRKLAASLPGVYILDYDGLVNRIGHTQWRDERKWLTVRLPFAANHIPTMAKEWLRFIHPLAGKLGKVVVTDLDNTLWGGVIGEDGMDGIQLSRDHPGATFRALQRALLDLHNRGILLAVASKNNEADALEAIEKHPEMLLRPRHFSALQIHWNSKVESLRAIAQELNVGLDSLVFLDDNPAERQSVRLELPQVTVIELPADPAGYAQSVRDCPLFERLTSSEEDRQRGAYYADQRQRKELEQTISSVTDYYYSLEQHVELARVTPQTLPRVAQLLKKTNQFNLTTRRHSESEIAKFAADPDWDVYAARVTDRFGDNGLTGVCITRRDHGVCEIDTLLLSCRVIGRTVETAILHKIAADCREHGIQEIRGWFLPTEKNKPAEPFFSTHGFQEQERTEQGTAWTLQLEQTPVACPPWIKLSVDGEREYAHA